MSGSSQTACSSKDPVRVVYHAGNRTFARLFNEHSLEEVKDIIRRKLGLGAETDVSLKQMTSDALLDLEDDGDFQAFRVFLKSSVSADIQVTVGKSQGPAVPPPVTPQPREHPSASKSTMTTSLASSSREPTRVVAFDQPRARPGAVRTTETSTAPAKTPLVQKGRTSLGDVSIVASAKPAEQRSDQPVAQSEAARVSDTSTTLAKTSLARKRKMSFDNIGITAADESTEQCSLAEPAVVTPVVSAKATGSPSVLKPVGAEEPLKKKQKREPTKKKVQITETVESPASRPSVPTPEPKKSTTSSRRSKVGVTAPKDGETPEPPAKKQRKLKKDGSTGSKKAPAAVDQDGMDQPASQSNNEASLQPAVGKFAGLSTESDVLKTHKSEVTRVPRGTACAAIPQTSASTSIQSEVAAAILSAYLSKPNETLPPVPSAKRKSVRRAIKRSSASSSALPVELEAMPGDPARELLNVATEHRTKQMVSVNESLQRTPELSGPPCPICLAKPFHIRYYCPTVLKGPDAIRERLEELKKTDLCDQRLLIKQLERLLCDPKVTSNPSLLATSIDGVQLCDVSLAFEAPLPRTPTIPSSSRPSEVIVESRDEESSPESSNDMSSEEAVRRQLSASCRQKAPDTLSLESNTNQIATIRGPASKPRSGILSLLDRILSNEDDESSSSEEERAELEEDREEENGRSRYRSSRRITHSSDSEDEGGSTSPSPWRSAEDILNHLGPGVQGPSKSTEESAKHQDGDIVMRRSVDFAVLERQHGDSSEETRVELEDCMVVDKSIRKEDAAIITEERTTVPVPRASTARPSDTPSREDQEFGMTRTDPALNRDGVVSASEVLKEVEADPIEPADDLAPPTASCSLNIDPIETSFEDVGPLFASVTQSTPKPGVSKRIKTRNGVILDDEADRPVLLEHLTSRITNKVTPIPAKGKSQRMVTETPASQMPVSARRSPRFSSVLTPTSTPAALALLQHRSKSSARIDKAAKTLAKRDEEQPDVVQSNVEGHTKPNGSRIAPAPSLIGWETLAEPSSPSLQLDEQSVPIDELVSSSPQPDDDLMGCQNDNEKRARPRRAATSSRVENSRGKERLLGLSSSQTTFLHSQNQATPVRVPLSDGKQSEETTDSGEDVAKDKTRMPVQYRRFSTLAHQMEHFSPSLPTPTNNSLANGNPSKRAVYEESSSSSSSDPDEAIGSQHIPAGRRAGSTLEKKSTLSIF